MYFRRVLMLWLFVGSSILPGSDAAAVDISLNIQTRHLPFGTILDPFYASSSSNVITGYTRCGDSAIWTGHYLAAEAYRYRVTGDAAALEYARKAVSGIRGLVDVTGTNLLARCRIAIGSPFAAGIHGEEAANGVYTNTPLGWTWIGNTSRDQYCGVYYGLGTAYSLIPDSSLRAEIADIVARMTDFLLNNNWSVPMPDGRPGTTFALRPDVQLALLQVARLTNPVRFGAVYETQRSRLASSVSLPVAFDSLGTSSYFKFNLIYITFFSLIRIEDPASRGVYERAYAIARNYTANHKNAFFNMIDAALFGPDIRRDAETRELLALWLKRPRRDFYVDLAGKVPVCGDQACQPIPVDLRTPTDFLWQRNPFQLTGGGAGTIGNAGIDYILPYWMARYYGVIPGFAVQSSAAPTPAIAPDSLASLYGTFAASRVRILDSVGGAFDPTILYSSTSQINLHVPAAVAIGEAVVEIDNPDGSRQSASVVIRSVAPALFTLNGSWAAATAVRVVNGRQAEVPVFHCPGAECVPTPIGLSENAPVYLTLYGTGIRYGSSALATVKGVSVPILYSGPQPSFPGLDQVNIELPATLRGSGEVDISLFVDDQPANLAKVVIQ
ncbi:MAG TPA: hypothetical protein VFQ91_22000 [Bryobacteraceae bacterium]|nr:hypothetical protein [Bryobacteraceae bacterium]